MSAPPPTRGVQRAAVFLSSLEREAAAALLKHLDPATLEEVVRAMAELDRESLDEQGVRALYRDLARDLHGPTPLRVPDQQQLAALLVATVGEEMAERTLAAIRARRLDERPFLALESHPPRRIGAALASESEAVAALVLAHLEPALSAEVLEALPEERSLAVVKRMAALAPPPLPTLSAVARELERRLAELSDEPLEFDAERQLRTIAEMLSHSTGDVERHVLDGLGAEDEAMAQEIREFMFTWTDLAHVDKRAMQKILASIDTKTLAIAIKACQPEVEENIMANLSSRVRAMVADERDLAGAMAMNEVLAARNEIMIAVRGLMESGEFRPARSGEDLVA